MSTSFEKLTGKVFIGHGRSDVWKDLRDFLEGRLGLECLEFNMKPRPGFSTKEVLEEMLKEASFAFVIMTAEDEQIDGTFHARPNVIHEAGLFQGRLGFTRAIVVLEDGCEEFSNVSGIVQIRFPKHNIMAKSEEIRETLERELQSAAAKMVTDVIHFDYLPDKLTNHGWKPGYQNRAEPELSAYSSPPDAPILGCVSIKTVTAYALDYGLRPFVCDGVQFDAQYSDSTMIFTEVGLKSRDGTMAVRRWIKYYPSSDGGTRSEVTEGYPNEYTLWMTPGPLPNGWVRFKLSLPDVVQLTWGKQGFLYESLKTIRLRGELSISPIRMTASQGH